MQSARGRPGRRRRPPSAARRLAVLGVTSAPSSTSREPVGVEEHESQEVADRAESVCVGCGLCCDGTVVSHLAVRDASDLGAPLSAMGVEVIAEADPPVFALPCPAVIDGVCAVYDLHRPRACVQFECALSVAVTRGETSLAAARSVVLRARRAQARADDVATTELRELIEQHFRRG